MEPINSNSYKKNLKLQNWNATYMNVLLCNCTFVYSYLISVNIVILYLFWVCMYVCMYKKSIIKRYINAVYYYIYIFKLAISY